MVHHVDDSEADALGRLNKPTENHEARQVRFHTSGKKETKQPQMATTTSFVALVLFNTP